MQVLQNLIESPSNLSWNIFCRSSQRYFEMECKIFSHAETQKSHAETQKSHAETQKSHAETQKSHAETQKSHAETQKSHAETQKSVTSWSHRLLELLRYSVVFIGWFKCRLTILSLGEEYRCADDYVSFFFVVTWSERCAAALLSFCIYFLHGNFYCITLVCEYSSLLYTVIYFVIILYFVTIQ